MDTVIPEKRHKVPKCAATRIFAECLHNTQTDSMSASLTFSVRLLPIGKLLDPTMKLISNQPIVTTSFKKVNVESPFNSCEGKI